jgi:large subunit ribosomal protein L18
MNRKVLNLKRRLRKKRDRAGLLGTAERPRLSVFRSNQFVYAQLIDDEKGHTLVSASESELPKEIKNKPKVGRAEAVGRLLAQEAKKTGIQKAVFNKGSYKYHGRVKALAEGARKGGLQL